MADVGKNTDDEYYEGQYKSRPVDGDKSKSATKSPVEKMRIRLAAEGYDGKYQPMDTEDDDDDSQTDTHKKKGNCCCNCGWSVSTCFVLLSVGLVVACGFMLLAVLLKVRLDQAYRVCQTPDCIVTSGTMMTKMNLAVDPCNDFYEYSCAGFISNVNIPPDKAYYSTLGGEMASVRDARVRKILETDGAEYRGQNSTAVAKMRQFYAACMNMPAAEQQGNEPLLQLIKSLQSWTVTSDEKSGQWDASSWNIELAVAKSHGYQFYPFFSTGVTIDDMNSDVTVIEADQEGLSLFDYQSMTQDTSDKFHKAYIDYFVAISTLLGGSGPDLKRKAEDVWNFEKELAGIYMKQEERADPRTLYNLKTVADLQSYFGSALNVKKYLNLLYGLTFDDSHRILIRAPSFFRNLGILMRAASSETLANYVVWHAVVGMVPSMPTGYRLAALQLKSAIYGVSAAAQQWERCSRLSDGAFGFATGALFVDKYFSEADKEQVTDLVNRIWSEFRSELKANSWMDEKTKQVAIEKAESLTFKVGYPDFILNVSKLDDYYSALNVTNSSFQNVLNAAVFEVRRNIAKYGKPSDRSEWYMTPADINAYYAPSRNQIVIPAGILQRPIYDRSFPMSVVFGAIGFVIGHEITHGFDNTGRQYDKYGNMVDWWGNQSAQMFDSLAQCYIDQYNAFEIYGHHINGISTRNENIADSGGLQISYRAYQKWLKSHMLRDKVLPGLNMTNEQQFFLGFSQTWCAYYRPQLAIELLVTDVHSNTRFRVNGAIQNMPEFAREFSCSSSASLNPSKRCKLWGTGS